MQRNKYVISRTTTAKAAVILRESEFTTPRQYLDLRIFLFDGSRITWADSDSEGRETIERFALDGRVLENSLFPILFATDGEKEVLAECNNGKGVICNIHPTGLNLLIAIPDNADIAALKNCLESGMGLQCAFAYKTIFPNSDFVELTGQRTETKTIYFCRIKRITEISGITLQPAPLFNPDRLREYCLQHIPVWQLRIYGIEHSDRVAENGKRLLLPGASPNVVAAFAYLHDAERSDSETDSEHGEKAALLVDTIRHKYLADLTDTEIELLKEACRVHGSTHKTGNPTIDICLDADRLDLPRLGIKPTPEQMATEKGAIMADG